MAVHKQNHSMFAGETKTITVTVRDNSTGELVDFTTASATWTLKQSGTTALTKTLVSGITNPSTGVLTITLSAANTTSLQGEYSHELRVTLSTGVVSTVCVGTIFVDATITA